MVQVEAFRQLVSARAGGVCEYCRLVELATAVTFHIDHSHSRSEQRPSRICPTTSDPRRIDWLRIGGAHRSFLKCRAASRNTQYQSALDRQIVPKLDAYHPEFLPVSAGFDAVSAGMAYHLWQERESFGWVAGLSD